jgi:hypothetical protein
VKRYRWEGTTWRKEKVSGEADTAQDCIDQSQRAGCALYSFKLNTKLDEAFVEMLETLKDIKDFLKSHGYDVRKVSEVIARAEGRSNE